MTKQHFPNIAPGLRVRYRRDSPLATLAGEIRQVSSISEDGADLVEVIDPMNPELGVVNAEDWGEFWSIYEPMDTSMSLPTREQIADVLYRVKHSASSLTLAEESIMERSRIFTAADAVLDLLHKGDADD